LLVLGQTAELFGKFLITHVVRLVFVIHDRHRHTPNEFSGVRNGQTHVLVSLGFCDVPTP
jgi:hypothetical protein